MFAKSRIAQPATPVANVNEPGRRGRPRKHPAQERIFGLTLRVPATLRNVLRRIAEYETEQRGQIVSIQDLMMELIIAEARARGADV